MLGLSGIFTIIVILSFVDLIKLNYSRNYTTIFVKQYERNYQSNSSVHQQLRKINFDRNIARIQELNNRELGSAVYGLNERVADITQDEIIKQQHHNETNMNSLSSQTNLGELSFDMLWQELLDEERSKYNILSEEELLNSLPLQFDYRNTTTVKNTVTFISGQWIGYPFAIASNIESLYKMYQNEEVVLSPQELIDCALYKTNERGYSEAIRLGGLQTEESYPFSGIKPHNVSNQCAMSRFAKKYTIYGYTRLPPLDENKMKIWLVKRGPLTVRINPESMIRYVNGVARPAGWCANEQYNAYHGAVIIGYGTDTLYNQPYWLIQNSWGTKWGEYGYYRAYFGENTCGLATQVIAPILRYNTFTYYFLLWIILIIIILISLCFAIYGAYTLYSFRCY